MSSDGCPTSRSWALVVRSQTVPLQKSSKGDVVPPVKVHVDDPRIEAVSRGVVDAVDEGAEEHGQTLVDLEVKTVGPLSFLPIILLLLGGLLGDLEEHVVGEGKATSKGPGNEESRS